MSTGNRKPPGRPKEEAERAAIAARQDEVRVRAALEFPLRLGDGTKVYVADSSGVKATGCDVGLPYAVDESALDRAAWKGTMRALLEHKKRSHEIGPRHRGMPVNYDRRLLALGGLDASPAEDRRDEQIDQIMRAAACDEHTARGDWYWLKKIYEGLQVTAVYVLQKNDGNS